jgi:hypothetical protein
MAQKKRASKKAPASDTSTETSSSSGKTLVYGATNLTQEEFAVVSAVREFEVADQTVAMFEEEHAAIFETYKDLIEERNQKREVADKLVRGRDVSCGPWKRYSESVKYDAFALYQTLGRDKFIEIGGAIGTEMVYSIDKDRAEMAFKTGNIPAHAIEAVRKVTPSFHAPKAKT